jgi:hypothetical protein
MRLKLSIVAILVVVLTAGGGALASTNGSSSKAANQTITLFSVEVQFADLDLGAPGFSLGDQFVFTEDLSETRGGPPVGTDGGFCTVVRIDEHSGATTVECVVTAELHGGQIAVQGLVTFAEDAPGTFVLAITGGTGAYKNARGQVTVEEIGDTEAMLTFELIGV